MLRYLNLLSKQVINLRSTIGAEGNEPQFIFNIINVFKFDPVRSKNKNIPLKTIIYMKLG